MPKRKDFIQAKQFANQRNAASDGISKLHSPETKGRLSFTEKVLSQIPNWSDFMQMRFPNSDWSKLCSSDYLVSCVPIGQ